MVAQPHLPRVRALQGWVVICRAFGGGGDIVVWGGGVCEAINENWLAACRIKKTGLLLAGLRINLNQRAPLAGFITPCVAVWGRSGLILIEPRRAEDQKLER